MNLLNEINRLESDLKYKKKTLKEITDKIKKEISDSYFKYSVTDTTYFRFALSLVTGIYIDKYFFSSSYKFNIQSAKEWKTNLYLNYADLRVSFFKDYYSRFENHELCGFICFKKDLHHALNSEITNIWKYKVKENNYIKSLADYKEEFVKEDFLELLSNYKETYDVHVINVTSLKIKDVVICIKKDII